MALTQITDHVARALSRVITCLRGTEFEALLRAFTGEVQTAEDALFTLQNVVRNPALAEGDCLDRLGAFVGAEVRGVHDDLAYRLRVAAAITRNRASGTPEDLIAVTLAFNPGLNGNLAMRDADVEGIGCATLAPVTRSSLTYQTVTPADAEELMRYLSRAAGVRVIYSYGPVDDGPGSHLKFDTNDQGFDTGGGFSGSVDQKTRN